MFWIGESAWGWRYNLPKLPGEILQGLTDNIPICCVIYYTFVKLMCLLIHGPFKSILPPNSENLYGHHEKRPPDAIIFTLLCDAVRKDNGNYFSQDLHDLDYWRCPICRIIDRREKLDWTTGSRWDYAWMK